MPNNTTLRTICGAIILMMMATCFAAPPKKVIALTFDDGPYSPYTEEILNVLQQHNVKATFFVMGGRVKQNPELLKKVFAAGNVIGNHTYSHPNLAKISAAAVEKEIVKTNNLIYQTLHVTPILFRPPFGMSSAASNHVVAKLRMRKVTWNYMVNDYNVNKTTANIIATNVIQHATPGAIITLHDGGGNREKTVQALSQIIPALEAKGYELVTVAEILNIQPYFENN